MIYVAHYSKDSFGPGSEDADFSSIRDGSIGKPVYATGFNGKVQIGEIVEVEETEVDIVVKMNLIDNQLTRAACDQAGWVASVAPQQLKIEVVKDV